MSVERREGLLPVPLAVVGQGVEFSAEYNGDGVEICMEYPDHASWSRGATSERYTTIAREDWEAIVAHVGTRR